MINKLKKKLKRYYIFQKIIQIKEKINIKKEFLKEYKYFYKYYKSSKKNIAQKEYIMLLHVHALEKGMTNKNPRPFGVDRVKALIDLITNFEKKEDSFAYSLSLGILNAYIDIYEKHNWKEKEEYIEVKNFLNKQNDDSKKAGTYVLRKQDILRDSKVDYLAFLTSRHSIRSFKDMPLKKDDIELAIKMAIMSPSACNRQMCKIWYIKNEDKINILKKHLSGLGNFNMDNKINFFVVTFDMNNCLFFSDRHDGRFNAGLMAMNFVNGLHSLGIGSCFLQFGNTLEDEMKLKEILEIPINDRIAIVIAAGYYEEETNITYSVRKDVKDIYFEK